MSGGVLGGVRFIVDDVTGETKDGTDVRVRMGEWKFTAVDVIIFW